MKNKEKTIQTLEGKIHRINDKIDDFQSDLEEFPKTARLEMKTVVDDLKDKRSFLTKRIETIRDSSDSAFKDLQAGLEMAWEDLSVAYESAKERFQKEAS